MQTPHRDGKAESRLQKCIDWVKRNAGGWSIIISAIALIVAALGYFLDKGVVQEQRDINVHAFAYVNAGDETAVGYGIRLTLINDGLRPIIVGSVQLRFQGRLLSTADTYLADSRLLDRYSIDPDSVRREQRPLPFAIEARNAQTIALLFDLEERKNTKQQVNQFCRAVAGEPGNHGLGLRVSMSPDTQIDVSLPIRGSRVPPFDWSAIPDASSSPRRIPIGIRLTQVLADASSRHLIRMDVWGAGRHYVVYRPVVGPTGTLFPLPQLAQGSYWVAFRDGDRVVVADKMRVPVPSLGLGATLGPLLSPSGFLPRGVGLPPCRQHDQNLVKRTLGHRGQAPR